MKKIIFILLAILVMAGMAEARTDTCLWVWNVDTGAVGTSDTPDEVHCSIDGNAYVSAGASYVQRAAGAKEITITVDTDIADGSTTSADLVSSGTATAIVSNVNVMDAHILASANCKQFDEGGVYYHTIEDTADEDAKTIGLTPIACFKVQLETSTDTGVGSGVVWTTVVW